MTLFLKKDQIFLDELKEIVLANLSDESFGVNDLAEKAGLSTQRLNRRLKSVSGNTVSNFIREVRLRKALEMIRNADLTIAEVAYKAGFNSPTYFNTCFHDFFGVSPGSVKRGEKIISDEPAQELRNTISKKRMALYFIPVIILVIVAFIVIGERLFIADNGEENTEKSIAVLPFINDSTDPDNEYFCNGMMEDILDQLSKIGNIKVKARSSVEEYHNTDRDLRAIGKKLGVTMILEGSVRKVGDDIRISTQLIDATTGYHIWSEVYDGRYSTEIFDFQSEIARKVASSLKVIITSEEEKEIDYRLTANTQAYDLCLKALDIMGKISIGALPAEKFAQNTMIALNMFDQALDIDPDYIKALDGKAAWHSRFGNKDSMRLYWKKVLALDSEHSDVMNNMAVDYMYSDKYDSAQIFFQKAIDNPKAENLPWHYMGMGQTMFMGQGRLIEALPHYQKAYDFGKILTNEGVNLNLSGIFENISYIFWYLGDYEKALSYMVNALRLGSGCRHIRLTLPIFLAREQYTEAAHFLDSVCMITACEMQCDIMRVYLYTSQQDFEKAEIFLEKAIRAGYDTSYYDDIYLSYYYKETGRESYASRRLKEMILAKERMIDEGEGFWIGPKIITIAAAYEMLGNRKKALEYLHKLEHMSYIESPVSIKAFPVFDDLRNDPEFISILNNLEERRDSLRSVVQGMIDRGELNL